MVRHVEDFRPELHAQPFGDAGILEQGSIDIHQLGADDGVSSKIAERTVSLQRKAIRVVPLLNAPDLNLATCHVVRPRDIAHKRPIESGAYGERQTAIRRWVTCWRLR